VKNLAEFHRYVLSEFPREACGLVVDDVFIPVKNISPTPTTAFEMDPMAFFIDHGEFSECLDPSHIVHSHTQRFPDRKVDPRTPSKADMVGQVSTATPWSIVYCDGQTVSEPITIGGGRPPLEGRPFVFNANDCLSLATDYYAQEHGIVLPVVPREWDWFAKGETLIDDHWELFGFYSVPFTDARPGDALLFRMGTTFTNHIGIYLGDNRMLHHAVGHLSCVDELARSSKYLTRIVRHKDLNEGDLPR
jgi:proteasome lid subunit RPN8/RPN11